VTGGSSGAAKDTPVNAHPAPEPPVSWQGLLGYLNFSAGKPDAKFQGQLHAAYRLAGQRADRAPTAAELADLLDEQLDAMHQGGGSAFGDVSQARSVIRAALRDLPPAYRQHHADLFATRSDADLFAPFFLVRACEAVLASRGEAGNGELVPAAVRRLNDYVGYRPVAVLENRRAGEVYDHERFRPVPIYLRGVGVAAGPYQGVVLAALRILAETSADLLDEAQFDPNLLEELAYDPRPYDHNHPANKRPNHIFGEWDPDHIDGQGRYRRFVVRQTTLDALLARIADAPPIQREERRFDVAAVLAGTILMASSLNGRGPNSYDSAATLSTIVPGIARLRDEFYKQLLAGQTGPRAERLRREAESTKQPFGGTRQHLNQVLAQERALQLQEHHLAHLFAAAGYPEESKRRADRIATPSVRISAAVRARASSAAIEAQRGHVDAAAEHLADAERQLRCGIDCGALADPWNMLGFQGLFPLFAAREDSIHDARIDELLELVAGLFASYAVALGEAAARGMAERQAGLTENLHRLATWWDQFAGYEVTDLQRVHGGDAAASAEHVATALALWRSGGPAASVAAELAFWREHLEGFRTAAAFGRVVAALLDRRALRSALALLMTWLDRTPQVPLEEDEAPSFADLADRWLRDATHESPADPALVGRFFELLEANAESYWNVPELSAQPAREDDDDGNVFGAAYEEMTYHDSADDGTEGAVLGEGPAGDHFPLEHEADSLRPRLRFLATVARLWRAAAAHFPAGDAVVRGWLTAARDREAQFDRLLDHLHALPIPDPPPGFEAALEFDRRRVVREQLIEDGIAAALANCQAARSLAVHLATGTEYADATSAATPTDQEDWKALAVEVEDRLNCDDDAKTRVAVARLLRRLKSEPLLYVPVSAGGHPRQILAARNAQALLAQLLERLPQLGLLRQTFDVVLTARAMERASPPEGRKVTEFDRLFPIGLQASANAVLDLADRPSGLNGPELVENLQRVARPYLELWLEHSKSLRLSVLEAVQSAEEWQAIREFVQRFGRELFTVSFLHLANLRAVLHRGVTAWLDELPNQDDPPEQFLAALDDSLPRHRAAQILDIIIQALVENYDEYRDYNQTTTQSDYGDNLAALLDLLRLKAGYERDQWRLRPLVMVHETLCRRGRLAEAEGWQGGIVEYTREQADRHLADLDRLEREYGLRLRTIRDRLAERFVAPLVTDRLCARLRPAWEAARAGADESNDAFRRLAADIESFAATPTGVGLEVPPWLRRLELEGDRLRQGTSPPTPSPSRLTIDALREQLQSDWTGSAELE
jgi:hypothetical protein